jgi:hypothetical protein
MSHGAGCYQGGPQRLVAGDSLTRCRNIREVMMIKRLPPGFIIPAQPVMAARPLSGTDWVHEIKHDGYRMIANHGNDEWRQTPEKSGNEAIVGALPGVGPAEDAAV